MDSVGADVAETASGDHTKSRRFASFGRVDAARKRAPRCRSGIDLADAERYLECRPLVARVDDRIDLEPGLVSVVQNLAKERLGINTKITDDERLEEQTKRVEVSLEDSAGRAQGRNGERRVDEVARR